MLRKSAARWRAGTGWNDRVLGWVDVGGSDGEVASSRLGLLGRRSRNDSVKLPTGVSGVYLMARPTWLLIYLAGAGKYAGKHELLLGCDLQELLVSFAPE